MIKMMMSKDNSGQINLVPLYRLDNFNMVEAGVDNKAFMALRVGKKIAIIAHVPKAELFKNHPAVSSIIAFVSCYHTRSSRFSSTKRQPALPDNRLR
ncbi:MAG: hypothetical protein ACD_39C00189G0002 [uncultured bacterium]|nr:MAG: hypothetical protein ACD_39C00189G0002 [uncultured bacterium]